MRLAQCRINFTNFYHHPSKFFQFLRKSSLLIIRVNFQNFEEFEKIISEMENIYSTAKICAYEDPQKCDLALEPELTEILATSRNPEQLKHIWLEFRKKTGRMVKHLYPRYVELSNIAAKLNNYSDNAAYWLKEYEAQDFQEQIGNLYHYFFLIKRHLKIRDVFIIIARLWAFAEAIWQQLKPLYLQLHAYVRGQLRKTYGDAVVSADGPIPSHLLGNMWAQTWSNIASFTTPFPGKQQPDVTEAMVKQGEYIDQRIYRHNAGAFFYCPSSVPSHCNRTKDPHSQLANTIELIGQRALGITSGSLGISNTIYY